jgi:hypothetical protein
MDTHQPAGGLHGITTHLIRQREALGVRWATERRAGNRARDYHSVDHPAIT